METAKKYWTNERLEPSSGNIQAWYFTELCPSSVAAGNLPLSQAGSSTCLQLCLVDVHSSGITNILESHLQPRFHFHSLMQ